MFRKKKSKIEEQKITEQRIEEISETPIETEREEPERYEVVCETTPYTLVNIITKNKLGDIESYFEFIYIDEFYVLKIKNTKNKMSSVYMDLSDNEKPYVEYEYHSYDLHVPRNTVIKRVIIGGNAEITEKASSAVAPFVAGTLGLATGLVLGSEF
jgi:hypothetical protein